MKLIKLVCPNCNAPLEVSSRQKKVKCKFCGVDIAIDDESINVKHTVISGDKEEKFKNADAYIKLKEYDKAYSIYKDLSNEYAYEESVWYSLVVCLTENFKNLEIDENQEPYVDIDLCNDYMDKYMELENDNTLKEKRRKQYDEYINKLNSIIAEEANKILERELKIQKEEEEQDKLLFKTTLYLTVALIVIIVLIIIVNGIMNIVKNNTNKPGSESNKSEQVSMDYYFSNSLDWDNSKSISEALDSDNLCLYLTIHSEDKDKYYKMEYNTSINGKSGNWIDFSSDLKDGERGRVCFTVEKEEDILDVGDYKFNVRIKNTTDMLVDSPIKVVKSEKRTLDDVAIIPYNLGEAFDFSSDIRKVSVTIRGYSQDIISLTNTDFWVYIDLKELTPGQYTVPVGAIAKNDRVRVFPQNDEVTVRIKKK